MRTLLRGKSLAVALAAGSALALTPVVLTTQATASNAATTHVKIVAEGGTCKSFFCFQAAKVKIPAHHSVTWTNMTTVTHTITRCTASACSGHGGGTGTQTSFGVVESLAPGHSYTFTFTSPGTYVYYCAIHGYSIMHGTITVT